jgi:hypothetical protein
MPWPRVLIYKRNHTGDPDSNGIFGCGDCMGRIRGYRYDAVIGIGVSDPWPGHEGIASRISWVGVGPRRIGIHRNRGAPLIRFDRWKVFNSGGKVLRSFAPHLATHFYAKHRRYFFSDGLSDDIQREIGRILRLARGYSTRVGGEDGLTSSLGSRRTHSTSSRPVCPPKRAPICKPEC